jgi:hypothetical protein
MLTYRGRECLSILIAALPPAGQRAEDNGRSGGLRSHRRRRLLKSGARMRWATAAVLGGGLRLQRRSVPVEPNLCGLASSAPIGEREVTNFSGSHHPTQSHAQRPRLADASVQRPATKLTACSNMGQVKLHFLKHIIHILIYEIRQRI